MDPEKTISSLIELSNKLGDVKAKYQNFLNKEDYMLEILKKRIDHLQIVESNIENLEILNEYHTTRLERLLVDYFFRKGYFKSGETLMNEAQIQVI